MDNILNFMYFGTPLLYVFSEKNKCIITIVYLMMPWGFKSLEWGDTVWLVLESAYEDRMETWLIADSYKVRFIVKKILQYKSQYFVSNSHKMQTRIIQILMSVDAKYSYAIFD